MIQATTPPTKTSPWPNVLGAILALAFLTISLQAVGVALFPLDGALGEITPMLGTTFLWVTGIGSAIGAVVIALLFRASWKITLGGIIVVQLLSVGVLYLVNSVLEFSGISSIFVLTTVNVMNYFIAAWAFGANKGQLPKLSFDFTRAPSVKIVLLSLLIWIATTLIVTGYASLVDLLNLETLTPTNNTSPLLESAGNLTIALVVAGVIVPVGEEMFFRGFLLQRLRGGTSTTTAIVFSSIVFAIAHIDPSLYVPIFILGVALGVSYIWLKSIWAPITIHVAQNFSSVIFLEYFGDRIGV